MSGYCPKKCSTVFLILCNTLVGTDLSAGSADGVEVFIECTVACNHVEDGSVAHLVRKLIGSYG